MLSKCICLCHCVCLFYCHCLFLVRSCLLITLIKCLKGLSFFFFFFGGGGYFFAPFPRADFVISALFPGKRAERRRKINFRPLSRKKGGKFIFRLGGGWRAEGGFYPGPTVCVSLLYQNFILNSLPIFSEVSSCSI